MLAAIMIGCAVVAAVQPPAVEVRLEHDNTVIDRSCRVVIPDDAVIEDADGNGVLHVKAPGVVVEFAPGSVLRGAKRGLTPDQYRGVGVRIDGASGVTIHGLVISGFKVGVLATGCDGLVLEDCSAKDLFRHRLKSTPQAEDSADWLWPHANDGHEWRTNYGAAWCIERSTGATVRRCRVRESQNGLILDRADGVKVYDNDFSFLSGWGVAMWRSSGGMVSRNALDFCIRGYSHGVYNRGQDSAGLLMFEQCSGNVIAENSATHGGDGVFGFAGKEALGETALAGFGCAGKGCNGNVFRGNDLSYAAAHGLEMTFSFDNMVGHNRFEENAICGIWGGYSQRMVVSENTFSGNGLPGQREGGAINIEHGYENRIERNRFDGNTVGVALWWDDDGALLKGPWARANYKGSAANTIKGNTFAGKGPFVRLLKTRRTVLVGNNVPQGARLVDADAESAADEADGPATAAPKVASDGLVILGDSRPVGARGGLRGRDKIIIGEWGPWDHESPLMRLAAAAGDGGDDRVELFNLPADATVECVFQAGKGEFRLEPSPAPPASPPQQFPKPAGRAFGIVSGLPARGVVAYEVRASSRDANWSQTIARRCVRAAWSVTFFPWTIDPREDAEGWRAQAKGDRARSISLPELKLAFGGGGPGNLKQAGSLKDATLPRDRFGTIASTAIPLTKGRWRVSTLSDDGVRVMADGKPLIENWTWHGPTRDEAVLTLDKDGEVVFVVEHFELDGHAVLELDIAPAD